MKQRFFVSIVMVNTGGGINNIANWLGDVTAETQEKALALGTLEAHKANPAPDYIITCVGALPIK